MASTTERTTADLVSTAVDLLARRLSVAVIDNDIRVSDDDDRIRGYALLDASILEALVGWRIDHLNHHLAPRP